MPEQIEHLLRAPTSGADAPTQACIEETLTGGYAQALALEAERLRLERRITEIAREVDGSDFSAFAEELSTLGRRLTRADRELATLRELLVSLRQRARTTRLTS
jgi:ABC-type phosphate transport system auxiliary subunit